MDIDGLKRINDSHGHQAGDRVLMQVAMSLRRSIRSVDTAARIGGDEFCVLLPQQDLKSAAKLAARLATAVEEEVASPGDPPVTHLDRRAALPEHGDDAEALIDTADRAMYRAKAAGEGIALGRPARHPGRDGRGGHDLGLSSSARVDSSMCGRSASGPCASSSVDELLVVGRDPLEGPGGGQLEHEQPQLGARLPVDLGQPRAVRGRDDRVVKRLVEPRPPRPTTAGCGGRP